MTKSLETENTTSARRRLIKGGFAVPVALTVASGSALARTSSGCLAREAARGEKPEFDTANATWHRALAYAYRRDPSSAWTFWIQHQELDAFATASGVSIAGAWIRAGEAVCVQGGPAIGTADFVAGQKYSSSTNPALPPLLPSNSGSVGQPRFYALLLDVNGHIVGVDKYSSVTSASVGAVHQSCWNSFAVSK